MDYSVRVALVIRGHKAVELIVVIDYVKNFNSRFSHLLDVFESVYLRAVINFNLPAHFGVLFSGQNARHGLVIIRLWHE